MDKYNFQIRVTAIVIKDKKLLVVKQDVNKDRSWSLPGGRVERGETLEYAIEREVLEETGLVTRVNKLLYLCDKNDSNPPIIHISFLMDYASGDIVLPTNEFDSNPISDVKFVEFEKLTELGFTQLFVDKITDGFSDSGSYMGLKKNIGL